MTGITKDELMQMAQEAPFEVGKAFIAMDDEALANFANAILERAAVELEGAWYTAEAADSIRALKINTGD